uniref:Variant erythrocyte surface antigen-1, alpha subunit n=1 Tax=Babesia bovis TaxID=5865 RepID=A7ASQ4_BABBO|eukprot:XP_001609533.1 variant erythrocyte surface antigen-1, alpha subunit [Babesia bovis T2Bo]
MSPHKECICGLAAAVTDLLQSVQLEYHGYQGEAKDKGPQKERVEGCLNEVFSLVQGLGGTAVVRTYIDQLAQVLSALVGWSKIDKCWQRHGGNNNNQHGNEPNCGYLTDVKANTPCKDCQCMKWSVTRPESEGTPLGRKCTRCSDSSGSDACNCSPGGGDSCTAEKCKCALAGKCCKCCCKSCNGCKENAKCSCMMDDSYHCRIYKDTYQSAYISYTSNKHFEKYGMAATWNALHKFTANFGSIRGNPTEKRSKCARILLGSVCLIWSGLTYMYWTGKYHSSSPRWNNHILDGTGLDDGTLSQWLQALGFPKAMLNDAGPGNRLDAVIWDGFRGMLYLGFPDTGSGSGHGWDTEGNTFRDPSSMNYAGYIHTLEKGAFCSNGNVFPKNANGATITEEQMHKCGALFKLYILSCAYFTGLQNKAPPKAGNTTPKTIREILYWLSALPYSPAYPEILKHGKDRLREVTQKPGDNGNEIPTLAFHQTGRNAPITVHEFNLFAHFQAVTQYCPLVLIGIQGGIHSTNRTTPAIHSLYANTECHFTYPTVSIQAYNQVVHYIRALFYQLYFLRKQCAVKVALGGKWRECRYGKDVVSKGVISWMCLGCDPMEHDRKWRVKEMGNKLNKLPLGSNGSDAKKIKDVLEAIGQVVVQLGNAQEALEGKDKEAINAVKTALEKAKGELEEAVKKVNGGLDVKLGEAKTALEALTNGGSGILGEVGEKLETATNGEYDPGKNKISESINKVREVLKELEKVIKELKKKEVDDANELLGVVMDPYVPEKELQNILQREVSHEYTILLSAIEKIISICTSPKCSACDQHSTKCGQKPTPSICKTCLQPTTTGVPSPLQAFLEDRLPGFSCKEVVDQDENPDYPSAASHLGHCNGSGQCCPLPMGFRGQFYSGSTSDSTGARLYGILYFFSNENMMQSCVYTLVRVTAALSATTPQVLGDVFGFFRGGIGEKERGKNKKNLVVPCDHTKDPSKKGDDDYFCGWCASGLRDEVKKIEWIPKEDNDGGKYRGSVGEALINIKGDKGDSVALKSSAATANTSLSRLTKNCQYLSPLTGELYTAVSATFGGTYLSWVLYLSDALHSGLESLSDAFKEIECRGCRDCDPNKCKKGVHGQGSGQCGCQSIVSCTGVLPVLYRYGFGYGNVEALHYSKGEFY